MPRKLTQDERKELAASKSLEELRHMVKVEKTLLMSDFGLIRSIQRGCLETNDERVWLENNAHKM